jgi:microsomal dipeptidase-like Zn-dependent dipeptidase
MIKKLLKLSLSMIVIAIIGGAFVLFGFAPGYIARTKNVVLNPPPYVVSERARSLHAKLLVADLHADSLLWNYDLNQRQTSNHVDVPRLIEANVALQAFTVVTKTPRAMNIESNTSETDNIFWLAVAQRQPLENLSSLAKRALWQAARLHDYANASGGKLTIIKSKADLAAFLERRKTEKIVGGWLGIEGAQALDGRVENVDVLFDAGFRMMSPSHFFDTEMGGSAHGVEKGGLTDAGREMIRRMESKKMIVDLAHASPKTIDDVLSIATRPVVVSHTGIRGTCDNQRNLSDAQLRAIAKNGGVVGIGFWDTAVCGSDAAAIAKAIRHAANVVGIEHVALGSDFDGAVTVPFDVTGVPLITEALINEKFSDDEIAAIMGGNVARILGEILPD